MFWKRLRERFGLETPGETARRMHSAWLTEAISSGRSYPRIPIKPVDRGGFGDLARRPHGPSHAERWWNLALARVDEPMNRD